LPTTAFVTPVQRSASRIQESARALLIWARGPREKSSAASKAKRSWPGGISDRSIFTRKERRGKRCTRGEGLRRSHSLRLRAKLQVMPQFVIEREILGAGALSEPEIRELSMRSLEALREMGPQIQWLHSYVTEDKVYCVYLAPDESSIREHARKAGIPADRVSAVRRLINPDALK
jgi:Protein of unknown function (DUF4242)